MAKLIFSYYPQPVDPELEKLEKKIFWYSLVIPCIFLIVIWLVKLVELTFGLNLYTLGVYPRHFTGCWGIITSPLIHADFKHLMGNSTSFLILATSLFYFYRQMAIRIFLINYVLSGLLLWLGGREVWHIGASGIIYGLAAFLLVSGLIRKDIRLLTISLIVVFLYGSLVWGLFPIEEKISWDGHLMGACSGTILAFLFYQYGPPLPRIELDDDTDELIEEDEFNSNTIQNDENTDEKER